MEKIQIENLPDEIGEETALDNRDDGTIYSKILGSTVGKHVLLAMGVSESNELKDVVRNEDPSSSTESEADTDYTESGEEEEEESDAETDERQFDKNPTVLYALVQKKLWKETLTRAKSNPKEARAFISRREKGGRIRWRLLPLHAAIVFKAPEEVIETILTAYPNASRAKDDQGMLPLHLAFRNGASEAVVNLLLLAFPESVDSPDRKDRVPLTLAKAAASPNREIYIKALEKGPSHYGITALACARDRIVTEQEEIFEAKLAQARQFHDIALIEAEANAGKKQQEIQDNLTEKENELTKIHENSQVLVEHVTSLEAQMNTRSDTERFLATKIAKLEQKIKENETLKDERETFWKTTVGDVEEQVKEIQRLKDESEIKFEEEKAKFNTESDYLLTKVDETQNDLSSTRAKLAQSIDTLKEKEEEWDIKEKKLVEKHNQVEVEWANSQANCAIFDSQLKKRMENEHSLASQVSTLASRLAESADNAMKFTKEIKELEDEKYSLKNTVREMTTRLQKVTSVMENTRKHQMTILDDAIAQEEMMAKSMETHARVVSETLQQETELRQAKVELMELVERTFREANEKRQQRYKNATDQGQYLSGMNKTRRNMLVCAQSVTLNVIRVLESELNLGKGEEEEEINETEERSEEEEEQVSSVVESNLVGKEIRDEAEEMKAEEETPTESSKSDEKTAEDEAEYVEVMVSPKKSAIFVVDVAVAKAEEEGRTEMDETRPEEVPTEHMNVGRVMAE